MRKGVLVLVLLLSASIPARAEISLKEFLRDVEEATQVPVPLRGDGQIEVTTGEASRRDQVAMIVRPPSDLYIDFHQAGTKALILNPQAFQLKAGAGKAEEFASEASLGDTDFTREDLEPFRLSHYRDQRISDETATDVTITLFPKDSQYSLVVVTFDREKKVPLKTLYYRETLNNLVKLRRDGDYALIGRKWMPTTTSMETFKLKTRTTFTLRWSQSASFPPELFDPVFLPRPSSLVWPAAAATPAP